VRVPSLIRRSSVILITAVVALASCGTKELSRDGFIDAVARTCESANLQLERIAQPSPAPDGSPDPVALASFLADALAVSENAADVVRAMRAPDELKVAQEQLVAAMDAANEGLADAVEAAEASDEQAMAAAVAAIQTGRSSFDSLTASMGIDACRTLPASG